MKRPLLFLFVPVLACALISATDIPDLDLYKNGLRSETFGPYFKGQNVEDYEITVTASPSLRNKKISIKMLVYNYTFTKYYGVQEQILDKVLVPRTIYLQTFIRDYMNDEGIGYIIQYSNFTSGELLLEYRIPLRASHQQDITLDINTTTINSGYAFRLNKTEVEFFDYDLNCYNFTDYLYNDKYYRLDLTQFYFTTQYADQMDNTSFQMIILSPGSCFPLLPREKNGTIALNIKFVENNGEFHINFKQKLFVEPQTLEMSTYQYMNFELTRYFYLPRNQQASMDGMRFRFVIKNMGATKNNISWDVRYTVGSNLIGECYDSDYCIGSGVRI